MKRLLSFAYIWILALPLFLNFVGAGMNQAVIAANHDKFPVMVNHRKADKFGTDADGMLDDVHCLMTKDTNLNFLADWIDLKEAIYSPGDLLLIFADYLSPLVFPAWFAVMLVDTRRKNAELENLNR
jgi:hypothetical protein